MLGEFLARLAIALPLVCAAAVVTLLAVKRGWIRLPGFLLARSGAKSTPGPFPDLAVTAIKALTPSSRVAVVRFHGRDHLVGITGNCLVLLAAAGGSDTAPSSPSDPEDPHRREPAPWTS
ncbi:MAG: flagellar biosynthetic protein FliO [Sandarakinorhabdus sp.]|nr:flagellar biosynthetic protein FliO [Sandarakinorhabdus sp.]